jgi:molybdenum cofactor biosynthesis enzyme MoaA
MVELSNACNHACIFCTNPNMTRRIGRMDGALLDRVMVEAYGLGVQEIGFYTTGEPFVHKDLEKFISRAAGIGYSYIYISTNGAMAEPERAKRAIDAGLTSIKFSINAGSRETYRLVHGYDDWDKVMANLRFVSRYRKTLDRPVKLFVTYIVTRHTEHEIAAFRENVGPLVDEILFCPVHNQSGQMNETQEMLTADSQAKSFKSDNICRMPFNRLHVTCEGYLTLCCVDYQNYLAIADLKETSLMDAWNSPTFQAMRVRHLQGDLKGTLCGNCWYGHKDKVEPLVPALATETDFPTFYRSAAERVARRIWESSEQRDARRGDEDDA